MLNIAICDDEQIQREYLTFLVNRWARERGLPAAVSGFAHAEAFLFQYEEQKDFDILLLDIQMKEMNGITLAEKIRQEDETVQIIFITAFTDYMPYGYDVSALHYLIKPVHEEKLFRVLDQAVRHSRRRESPMLITTTEGLVKVLPSDIYYVEAFAHSCSVVMNNRKLQTAVAIGEMEARLGDAFIRCHRSYLVHAVHITALMKNAVRLDNGDTVPVSRRLYQRVSEGFLRFFHSEQPDMEGEHD